MPHMLLYFNLGKAILNVCDLQIMQIIHLQTSSLLFWNTDGQTCIHFYALQYGV